MPARDTAHDEHDGDHTDERIREITSRLDAGSRRMLAIEAELKEHKKELALNTEVTTEIRDILRMGRAGLRVLGGLGSIAKWLGGIAAAALSIWGFVQTIKSGLPPHK